MYGMVTKPVKCRKWMCLGVEKEVNRGSDPTLLSTRRAPDFSSHMDSLHDFQEYLRAAEDLVDNGASLNVFLTTEDEGIINNVENETISAKTSKNFTFYYTR